MIPLEPECTYHIYNRANGFEKMFREPRNYDFFMQKFKKYILPISHCIAYCLIPNHFHFLLQIKSKPELEWYYRETFQKFKAFGKFDDKLIYYRNSKQFANFFSCYTQSFNKIYKRPGGLFQSNFKRKLIDSQEYLQNAIAYIHTNPIHHEIAGDLEFWPYNSYQDYLDDNFDVINPMSVFSAFSSKNHFLKYHIEKNISLKDDVRFNDFEL